MVTQNLILDFSHIYPEGIETDEKEICRINMSDIEGTNLYCSKEAEEEIRKRLKEKGPHGIHFLDNGNYHYLTKFFLEKIRCPFSLVLFDYHSDMQEPMIKELLSCGSWVREVIETNRYLEQIILIGPDQKSIDEIEPILRKKLICISIQELEKQQGMEKAKEIRTELPAYFSIDKDVLDRYSARTNWNQGKMSIEVLEYLLSEFFGHMEIIGVDICGECDVMEDITEKETDCQINMAANQLLYRFISPYLQREN